MTPEEVQETMARNLEWLAAEVRSGAFVVSEMHAFRPDHTPGFGEMLYTVRGRKTAEQAEQMRQLLEETRE